MKPDENQLLISRELLERLFRVTWNAKIHAHNSLTQAGYDISPEQMMVMGFLWRKEGISQNEICKFTGKSKSNMTRTLDNLVRKNWVYREIDHNDRRSFRIFLTDEGKGLKDKIFPIVEKFLALAFKDFSKEDFLKFQQMLDKVLCNLYSEDHF